MTTEACVTKVAYLCGRGLEGDALRDAMETDLRGERSADQGAATDIAHQRASTRAGSLQNNQWQLQISWTENMQA